MLAAGCTTASILAYLMASSAREKLEKLYTDELGDFLIDKGIPAMIVSSFTGEFVCMQFVTDHVTVATM